MTTIRTITLLCALALPVQAQVAPNAARAVVDSARAEIDRAVPRGDIRQLDGALALLERAATVAPNDPWVHHYIGYALYRRATLAMQRDGIDAKPEFERARTSLERSIRLRPIAESHALLSSILGQMIGSNPLKGITLGPRSSDEMDKAVALGPENPRVWMLRGVGAMYTPGMFGGGMAKAEQYLAKALELYALDSAGAPRPAWGRAEVHAWIGQIHAQKKDLDAARASYQRALEIEPDNGWVRTVLLPALDRRAKSERAM